MRSVIVIATRYVSRLAGDGGRNSRLSANRRAYVVTPPTSLDEAAVARHRTQNPEVR